MLGWMPRPVSWLRTSVLIGIASLMTGGLIFTGKYGQTLLFGNTYPSLFLLIVASALMPPFIAYAYIHCWILGNKPDGWVKKIPSPKSIKEAVLSYVVMFFGILIALVITSPFVPDQTRYTDYRYLDVLEIYSGGVAFSWSVISIYMFHGYDIITNSQSKKSVDKPKIEAPKNKVDSVDLELNRLKHQKGQMINQPSKKDIQ